MLINGIYSSSLMLLVSSIISLSKINISFFFFLSCFYGLYNAHSLPLRENKIAKNFRNFTSSRKLTQGLSYQGTDIRNLVLTVIQFFFFLSLLNLGFNACPQNLAEYLTHSSLCMSVYRMNKQMNESWKSHVNKGS